MRCVGESGVGGWGSWGWWWATFMIRDSSGQLIRGGGVTAIERWALRWRLGLGVCAAICLLAWLGMWVWMTSGDIEWIVLLIVGVFFATQWGLLAPSAGWGFRLAKVGRPMKRAIFFAALPTALLAYTLFMVFHEVVDGYTLFGRIEDELVLFGLPGCVWAFWCGVFYLQWRDVDEYTWLAKVLRRLIAGSLVEVFLSIGVYAWNPQNEDCECARGSFWGLLIGSTVFVWSFGPGVVLLFMHERYRDEKRRLLIQQRRDQRQVAGDQDDGDAESRF